MMTAGACEKSDMEADNCEVEQIQPEPSLPVFLLNIATIVLRQEEDVLVDEIASADTFMVS